MPMPGRFDSDRADRVAIYPRISKHRHCKREQLPRLGRKRPDENCVGRILLYSRFSTSRHSEKDLPPC